MLCHRESGTDPSSRAWSTVRSIVATSPVSSAHCSVRMVPSTWVVSAMLVWTRPVISLSCIWRAIVATAGPIAAARLAAFTAETGMRRAWPAMPWALKIAPRLAPSLTASLPPAFRRACDASLSR